MEKVPQLRFKTESAGTHFRFISYFPESWKLVGSLPSAFHGQVSTLRRAAFWHVPRRGNGV